MFVNFNLGISEIHIANNKGFNFKRSITSLEHIIFMKIKSSFVSKDEEICAPFQIDHSIYVKFLRPTVSSRKLFRIF